jgi:hypothetical protein
MISKTTEARYIRLKKLLLLESVSNLNSYVFILDVSLIVDFA